MNNNYKSYKLTEENRHLADSLQDTYVDDKNKVLWSKQDLSGFASRLDERDYQNNQLYTTISLYKEYGFVNATLMIVAFIAVKLMGVNQPGSLAKRQ